MGYLIHIPAGLDLFQQGFDVGEGRFLVVVANIGVIHVDHDRQGAIFP
ncbi:MAG: hypothetical protein JEZ12_06785 [Desulfobacterium sp.]|nr:hypothetical protein [Desulfobacterium sp.]